jgi:lipoprotein-anchoring transpeptidase ErfK/SrfK
MPELPKFNFDRVAFTGKLPGLTSLRDPSREFIRDYGARTDGEYSLPAIPVKEMDRKFLRQRVPYQSTEKPGTIIVDVAKRFLYLVEPGGTAMRYGVGVGRQGFEWQGDAYIGWKRAWPTWTPPGEMIQRQPELAKYSAENGGMEPGLSNPLGARALYLFQKGRDTLYRLHGTPQWKSIGTAASSGCIRLINQDIIDLYSRTRNGAKVVVRQ